MKTITKKEKNVKVFNKDVINGGGYVYTDKNKYSSVIARQRQFDEIVKVLVKYFSKNITILDVGCGDGAYTFDLIKKIKPRYVLAFDYADKAIEAAKKKTPMKYEKKVTFKTFSIYDIDKKVKKNSFDVAILSGVLHHLYLPQKAIKKMSKISNNVILIEPNGYNPILKVIEKVSPYHRLHEEKSYWPPTIHKWFLAHGYQLKEEVYFGLVPYFCNRQVAIFLKKIEPFIEQLPFVNRFYCGSSMLYYTK